MTIQVTAETRAKLARLATDTQRNEHVLAAEAVAAYVDSRLDVDGIERGLADIEADRVVPHEAAMAELYAVIEAAAARRT